VNEKKAIEKLRREKDQTFDSYMRTIKIIIDEAEKLKKRSFEHCNEMSVSGGYEYYSSNENKLEKEATILRFLSYKLSLQCNTIRELEGFDDSFIKIVEEEEE
tara:strand:+ start:325 stop:633 length:309 start_codon:yes stop_codon:yes gene_type:complete